MIKDFNILVVDDDKTWTTVIRHQLRHEFSVDTALSAAEAITYIHQSRPQLVISDVKMPDMDGLQLLDEIKKIDKDIAVILMSANLNQKTSILAVRNGAFDLIEKPIKFADLRKCIDRARATTKNRILSEKAGKITAQSSKLASIGKLADGVAHEINNPLAIISGYLELLEEDLIDADVDSELFENHLRVANENIIRIKTIVNGLRSFSQKNNNNASTLDLHSIIEHAVTLKRIAFSQQRIQFVTEFQAKNPTMKGNIGKLQQAFLTIFSNAYDALLSQSGGTITIKTSNEGDRIIVEINDDGPGICSEDLPHIFDAFYTTKEIGDGKGLGLSITHSQISAMKGEISAESQSGKGAHFFISFDVCTECSVDNRPPVAVADHQNCLIVDDDQLFRKSMAKILTKLNYETHEASGGNEALSLLGLKDYDYIFVDMNMPDMTGDQFIVNAQPRLVKKHTQIIVITSMNLQSFTSEQLSVIHNHVTSTIYKPFNPSDIAEVLESAAILSTA